MSARHLTWKADDDGGNVNSERKVRVDTTNHPFKCQLKPEKLLLKLKPATFSHNAIPSKLSVSGELKQQILENGFINSQLSEKESRVHLRNCSEIWFWNRKVCAREKYKPVEIFLDNDCHFSCNLILKSLHDGGAACLGIDCPEAVLKVLQSSIPRPVTCGLSWRVSGYRSGTPRPSRNSSCSSLETDTPCEHWQKQNHIQ